MDRGLFHDIDPRLPTDPMPFEDTVHATMIGSVRRGPNRKTFFPPKVPMISKPPRRK